MSERTKAGIRRSWWPGWIWAIPAAALLLLGWLLLRAFLSGGKDITITFDDVHGLKKNDADVVYRGMIVGKVTDMKLADDGQSVEVSVHIDEGSERYLVAGTRFWLRGAQTDLSDLSSLAAILSGPTIEMAPGPGAPTTQFQGMVRKPLLGGSQEAPQTYRIMVGGDAGGLKKGSAVKLRGFQVGEVTDIGFRYDPDTAAISTPVTVALYPSLFHLDDGQALQAAMGKMIEAGLHARLSQDPPLVGSAVITLETSPNAAPAATAAEGTAEIPAEAEGESIIDKVNKLPLDQIAQNLLDASHHIDQIVGSPNITNAIGQLDAALTDIHHMTQAAAPQIPQVIDSLRKAAAQLESVAADADKTLGVNNQHGVPAAVREISETARSVRDLADYLDRHPDALLKGRSDK